MKKSRVEADGSQMTCGGHHHGHGHGCCGGHK
jgi:hypothetical protein